MTIGPFGYDGFGVNDHADEYHPRIATLTAAYRGRDDIGHLLAAAPDLLAALEVLLPIASWSHGALSVDLDLARAAIAKAKGL